VLTFSNDDGLTTLKQMRNTSVCISKHYPVCQISIPRLLQVGLGYQENFAAIIQVNLRWPAPPVKNWRILLVQSFTAHMSLLMATSAFGLGRRR